MATQKPTSCPPKTLSQSILSTAVTFKLNSITGWDGNALTAGDFGTQAFGCLLSADRSTMELFEFDPATIASASISFLNRGLPFSGGQTPVTANKLDWTANETTVLLGTDTPQFMAQLVDTLQAQTIAGIKTFSALPATTAGNPLADNDLARKAYIDGIAIAGSPDSTTTIKGIGRVSVAPVAPATPIFVGDNDGRVPTQNENNLLGAIEGGTDFFGTSATGTDSYAITISPAISAYVTGMRFRFKTDVANTATATLAVSGLSALTIKKLNDQTLATGDIEAGQIVEVVYDGTDLQMVSQTAQNTFPNQNHQIFTGSGTWTRPAGVTEVEVIVVGGGGGGGNAGQTGSSGLRAGGGGGGAGYAVARVAVSGNVTVTIGAGGAGGTTTNSSAGSAGGDSSFAGDVTVTANGGSGGAAGSTANGVHAGGGGGGTTNADLGINGSTGDSGLSATNTMRQSGRGGSNPLGIGAIPIVDSDAQGLVGVGYGAGGSGATSSDVTNSAGGAGTGGVVIVKWQE